MARWFAPSPSRIESPICSASDSWLSSPSGKSPLRYDFAFASASSEGPVRAYSVIFSSATSSSSRSVSFLVKEEKTERPAWRAINKRVDTL